MRAAASVLVLALAACGQPTAPLDEPAAPAPAAVDPAAVSNPAPVKLDAASLVGGWSFDRTCATEDAMGLMPDGKVYFDEWGEGTWAVDPEGRLVLTLRELTPGVEDDGTSASFVMTFTADEPVGENLVGTIVSQRADMPVRKVNALRCPER